MEATVDVKKLGEALVSLLIVSVLNYENLGILTSL